MTNQKKTLLNVVLWGAQILLAVGFIYGGATKLLQPIDQLATMWPWTGQVPTSFVKLTGIFDLMGGIGVVLPALLRFKPKLAPIAAVCMTGLMICAIVFHVSRGEASLIGINLFFAALAAFVAWGRFRLLPVSPNRAEPG